MDTTSPHNRLEDPLPNHLLVRADFLLFNRLLSPRYNLLIDQLVNLPLNLLTDQAVNLQQFQLLYHRIIQQTNHHGNKRQMTTG